MPNICMNLGSKTFPNNVMSGFLANTRLFCGVMFRENKDSENVVIELESKFGKISLKSQIFNFNFTDYYKDEMGPNLKKIFVGFENPISPEEIVKIKKSTIELEQKFCIKEEGRFRRRVNIDPGYQENGKIVLASTKNRSQRIYVGEGIYAEVTLLLGKNDCNPLPWTYPDYKTKIACDFFLKLKSFNQ